MSLQMIRYALRLPTAGQNRHCSTSRHLGEELVACDVGKQFSYPIIRGCSTPLRRRPDLALRWKGVSIRWSRGEFATLASIRAPVGRPRSGAAGVPRGVDAGRSRAVNEFRNQQGKLLRFRSGLSFSTWSTTRRTIGSEIATMITMVGSSPPNRSEHLPAREVPASSDARGPQRPPGRATSLR